MPDQVLTLRQLNRALLDRQLLLRRKDVGVEDVVETLGGMQAQLSSAPFVGLWTRIQGFSRQDLSTRIADRKIVKATYIRGTLHLVTAEDFVRYRTALQPLLSGGWETLTKNRPKDFDLNAILTAAMEFIADSPRTFAEISDFLTVHFPNQDVGPMRYGVRTHLPLVQVPMDIAWSYPGNPQFALAEQWIDRKVDERDNLTELIVRYLRAFGPASITDAQSWIGAPNLKGVFEELRPQLVVYRDENRRDLFDLPDMPLPEAETAAPVRFLPEFDNILIGHSNRRRIISDEHRKSVYLPGLRVAATVLVDGFVTGTWSVTKKGKSASLNVVGFRSFDQPNRTAICDEGEQLIRFIEPSASVYDIKIID